VKCQLDVLRNRTRARNVRKALNLLPPTLDETYERILLNIDRDEREQVRIALQWLCFSARPLRLQEIAEAVVVDPSEDTFSPEDRLFEPHDIVSICRSLVSLNDDTSELRLAHFSVQEYLVSERIREGPVSYFSVFEESGETLLAEVCLSYIFLFDKPRSLSEESLSEWPLLDYACRNWPHHIRRVTTLAGKSDQHRAIAMAQQLFRPCRIFSFSNWLRVFEPDRSWIKFDPHKSPSSFATPLYYASICDLLVVASSLVQNGADVTARGGRFIHPVNAAAACNSYSLNKLLIQHGAEVNIADEGGWKPIHNASMHDNAELARLLIEAGAELEVRDLPGGGAMHIAAHDGHISMIRVLVEYDTEIDCRATFTRDDLEPGSTLEARWNIGRTPLMESAWNGQAEVIKLLLDYGADINAVDDHGMTALIRAARRGHEMSVKLLLDRGADATIRDKNGRTAEEWLAAK
jgi:ankyrin repeat protein